MILLGRHVAHCFCLVILQGGFWIATDGVAEPTDVAMALVKKGKEHGRYFRTGCNQAM